MLSTTYEVPNDARVRIYRAVGIAVGESTILCPHHRFGMANRPGAITIGSHCYVNQYCWFDAGDATITLGDHVVIAAGVSFQAITHGVDSKARRAVGEESYPITVEDGSWLGIGTIILPGVTIASGCITGAGAVVTSSTEPNGEYSGVPAVRIRDLSD